MASNLIATRVAEFLALHAPFKFMTNDERLTLAINIEIVHIDANETLFEAGQIPTDFIYVVREGAVKIVKNSEELVDVCDVGDVFGVRALFDSGNYQAAAVAKEECLIYAVPVLIFRKIMDQNNRVLLFFTAGFASGVDVRKRKLKDTAEGSVTLKDKSTKSNLFQLSQSIKINPEKQLIKTVESASIQETALLMREHRVGSCIIVNELNYPIGIITDTDLRNKVATGDYSIEMAIGEVMSKPVKTIPTTISVAECLIQMLRKNAHHLCVTIDGTPNSEAIGMVSDHDLLLTQSNNPAVIYKQIRKVKTLEQLQEVHEKLQLIMAKYLEQEIAIPYLCNIVNELRDAILRKAIRMAEKQLLAAGKKPSGSYCWWSLGSGARNEQLLVTDIDSAILFQPASAEFLELDRAYFLELATMALNTMYELGYKQDPADILANNPKWCLSIQEWESKFQRWVAIPDEQNLMYSTIFFDFRPISGEVDLSNKVSEFLVHQIQSKRGFLNFLAQNALKNPPPIGFFRNVLIEKSGEHKNEFDLKLRAMLPLADAARVLSLDYGIQGENNTVNRYRKLKELDTQHADLFEDAAHAYELLIRFRAESGVAQNDSGRYIKLEEMGKIEKQMLKNTFKPITELQDFLKSKYQF